MTTDQMRQKIEKVYTGSKWVAKVQAMPDNQVIAVYYNFLRTGKFEKPHTLRRGKKNYEQMSIFDFIEKENTNG